MEKLSQKEFEKLLKEKMLRSGKYLPTTAAHLSKLGKEPLDMATLPDILKDYEALMAQDYVASTKLIDDRKTLVNEPVPLLMAARNEQEISEESMQKIIRLTDEGNEKNKQQD
jgi:hypothetical protein